MVLFAITIIASSISWITIVPAFADLESITIDGPKRILYNSVFSFHVDVKGVSRASYGDFSVNISIVEKESGKIIAENPEYLLPGKNTVTWYGKEYGTGKNLITLKPGVPCVFRIQHVADTWEYEFLPVATVEDLTKSENSTTLKPENSIPLKPDKSRLPSWIKDVFIWYGEGKITEDEVINAIQFLVKKGIIVI